MNIVEWFSVILGVKSVGMGCMVVSEYHNYKEKCLIDVSNDDYEMIPRSGAIQKLKPLTR